MNENIVCQELEQMRTQYEMLKQHLTEHQHVKQEQMNKAVKGDMGWRIKVLYVAIAAFVISTICMVMGILNHTVKISDFILIALNLFMLGYAIYYQKKFRRVKRNIELNIVEAQRDLKKVYKQIAKPWWYYMMCYSAGILSALLLTWVDGRSVADLLHNEEYLIGIAIFSAILIPVMFISRYFNKNKLRHMLDMIEELEELENMNTLGLV